MPIGGRQLATAPVRLAKHREELGGVCMARGPEEPRVAKEELRRLRRTTARKRDDTE